MKNILIESDGTAAGTKAFFPDGTRIAGVCSYEFPPMTGSNFDMVTMLCELHGKLKHGNIERGAYLRVKYESFANGHEPEVKLLSPTGDELAATKIELIHETREIPKVKVTFYVEHKCDPKTTGTSTPSKTEIKGNTFKPQKPKIPEWRQSVIGGIVRLFFSEHHWQDFTIKYHDQIREVVDIHNGIARMFNEAESIVVNAIRMSSRSEAESAARFNFRGGKPVSLPALREKLKQQILKIIDQPILSVAIEQIVDLMELEKPNLGCATTMGLLLELNTRAELRGPERTQLGASSVLQMIAELLRRAKDGGYDQYRPIDA